MRHGQNVISVNCSDIIIYISEIASHCFSVDVRMQFTNDPWAVYAQKLIAAREGLHLSAFDIALDQVRRCCPLNEIVECYAFSWRVCNPVFSCNKLAEGMVGRNCLVGGMEIHSAAL